MAYSDIRYRLDIYKGYSPRIRLDHTEYFGTYEEVIGRYWEIYHLYAHCRQCRKPQLYEVVNCKWVYARQPDYDF